MFALGEETATCLPRRKGKKAKSLSKLRMPLAPELGSSVPWAVQSPGFRARCCPGQRERGWRLRPAAADGWQGTRKGSCSALWGLPETETALFKNITPNPSWSLGGTNNSLITRAFSLRCLNIPWLGEGGKKVRKLIGFNTLKNALKKKKSDRQALPLHSVSQTTWNLTALVIFWRCYCRAWDSDKMEI